jgi:hypothetical protein
MITYLIAHIGHSRKDDEHICWWKPDSKGYTICIDKAGEYSEAEARSICVSTLCIAVPKEVAASVSRSTPYYRRSNGMLAPLYDGTNHRPVPNLLPEWKHLLAGRLADCAHPIKPTPIGAKSRAIYLDGLPAAAVKQEGGAA